jgi:hypothetical protein
MLTAEQLSFKLYLLMGPLEWRLRKRRLKRFADEGPLVLHSAPLRTRVNCQDPRCVEIISDTDSYLARFNHVRNAANAVRSRRPTLTLLDLSGYKTFAEYASAVSRRSKGNDNRRVKAAIRKGYRSRIINRHGYDASILEIQRSKTFRSGGLVFAALMRPKEPAVDRLIPSDTPVCTEHWRIAWGVFLPTESGERLVAYAWIRRTGNFILTVDFMGHADFLRDGIMKMLMFDIVKWLVDRQDACVQGVEYFKYGAVEDGAEGLLEWKRRMMFTPYLLA